MPSTVLCIKKLECGMFPSYLSIEPSFLHTSNHPPGHTGKQMYSMSIPGYTLHSDMDGRRVKRLFPSLPCLFYTPCGPSLSNCHTLLVCLPSLQRTSFTRTQRGWLSRSLCSWNLAEPLVYSTCSVNKTKWDLTQGRVWIGDVDWCGE